MQQAKRRRREKFIHLIESDGNQIIRLDSNEALLKVTELFKSKDFENDSTFCRMVAYRNSVVDGNNKFIKP